MGVGSSPRDLDEIYADLLDHGYGGFAEYVSVPAGVMALKPPSLSLEEAAAVPLSELIGAGKVRPQIDRRYPFAELPAAIAYLEQGHARGKVVVEVA